MLLPRISKTSIVFMFVDVCILDLKWSLMVELSSYYYSDQSRYILNTFRDSDIKKAIEEMSN